MALESTLLGWGRWCRLALGGHPGFATCRSPSTGLIGDLPTVALVGTDGTIDWCRCPRFDSPSVFGSILDADRGGLFRVVPDCDGWSSKQLYLPDTNILITRFLMPDGVGEVPDFMPPPRIGQAAHRHRIIGRLLAVRGQMRFDVDVAPRLTTPGPATGSRSPRAGRCSALPTSTSVSRRASPLRSSRVPMSAPASNCEPERPPRSCSTTSSRTRRRRPTPTWTSRLSSTPPFPHGACSHRVHGSLGDEFRLIWMTW